MDDASYLVCDPDHLKSLLDLIIINYRPQCYPVERRTVPANTVYLLSRYALYKREDCVEGLHSILEGASIAIEDVCHVSR